MHTDDDCDDQESDCDDSDVESVGDQPSSQNNASIRPADSVSGQDMTVKHAWALGYAAADNDGGGEWVFVYPKGYYLIIFGWSQIQRRARILADYILQ